MLIMAKQTRSRFVCRVAASSNNVSQRNGNKTFNHSVILLLFPRLARFLHFKLMFYAKISWLNAIGRRKPHLLDEMNK